MFAVALLALDAERFDVADGLFRREQGGDEMNRLDLETVSFHQRVRTGYHTLAGLEPERWVIIDGARPFKTIQAKIWKIVQERMNMGN